MRLSFFIVLLILCQTAFGGAFDDRYPSARANGMANAFVAVANDVWAIYYNPAGLAQIRSYQAALAYQKPFSYSFFTSMFGSAAVPLPEKYGTAGIAVESFGVKYNGNTMDQEYTATFSHGFYLLNDIHTSLAVGYNLKYYYMDLGTSVGGLNLGSGGTLGVDLGFQASIYKRTYLGMYVYNINSPSLGAGAQQSELTRRVVIGAAYRPYTGLTTTISANKLVGRETQFEGGFEVRLLDILALRIGAATQPNRFTAGLGITWQGLEFDYGFRSHPVLSETHVFGVMYTW